MNPNRLLSITCAALLATPAMAGEWRISGSVDLEARYFFNTPSDTRQFSGSNISIAAQPEFYREWNSGKSSFTFTPYLRTDQHDRQRRHADIRELQYLNAGDNWEIRIGIGKVFWGVTESAHLVDIINQTDLVDSPDGEAKLGQPMLKLSLVRDSGTWDLFVLPYFRERTFPGHKGRLRSALPVDTSQTRYESGRKKNHVDFAIRWSHNIGAWDIGLSHFSGTSREPRFVSGIDGAGSPVLIPVYDQIEQTGIDLQATKGEWLWKLELIHRRGQLKPFTAFSAGFEYTFTGIRESRKDLGLLMEYHHDTRDAAPMQNDLMLGARLAFNDTQSTEILFGLVVDVDNSRQKSVFIEASRRLSNTWKLGLEARFFSNVPASHALHGLRSDDYLQLKFSHYF